MSESYDPWNVACQAFLSMGFSRQEYWSGLPFSSPGDLPDPGIEPRSPAEVFVSLYKFYLFIFLNLVQKQKAIGNLVVSY